MPVVDTTVLYAGLNRLTDQGAGMAVSALHPSTAAPRIIAEPAALYSTVPGLNCSECFAAGGEFEDRISANHNPTIEMAPLTS